MEPIPTIFIFDLDETLFQVSQSTEENKLSKSAEMALSSSQEGLVDNWELVKGGYADRITAIARREIKEIFDAVYEVIKNYHNSPISVKVITSATYSESCVKKLFDHFYADGDRRFSTNAFPIEFFNREDLDERILFFDCKEASYGRVDLRKSKLITQHFFRWAEEMPGLMDENIFFIDNADYNTIPVGRMGFSALHYPTTHQERLPGIQYAESAVRVFNTLRAAIARAAPA